MTISELATDRRLRMAASAHGVGHADDIIQDTILTILEFPKERIAQIEKNGSMLQYAIRIAHNMALRMHNPKRNPNDNLLMGVDFAWLENFDKTQAIDLADNFGNTGASISMEEKVEAALERLYGQPKTSSEWYKRELFKIYIRLGSFRKVQKETGLDYSSVFRTIKEVKDEIRTVLNSDS